MAPVSLKGQPERLGLLLAVQDKCKGCNEARASIKAPMRKLKPEKRAVLVGGDDDDLTGRAPAHHGRRDGDDQTLGTSSSSAC